MQMTKAQKQQFFEEGYVLVRGAVPKLMADQARRAINRHMRYRVMQQGRNPGLSNEPVITDLFNKSPLWGLCESVVGEGNLIQPQGGNVKLNFPDAEERPLTRGHLDLGGKLKDGLLSRGMTLLVVILVHDVPRPFMGNFCFWPGSHRAYEAAFQKDPNYVETAKANRRIPDIDLPHGPIQFMGEAGDAVICHHQMYHNGGPNHSPDIRYAVIFRPRHVNSRENSTDAMVDIWREFEGLNDLKEEAMAV